MSPDPGAGGPAKSRTTIYDRVCQQAMLNRLAPIFEPVFDDANFGRRRLSEVERTSRSRKRTLPLECQLTVVER